MILARKRTVAVLAIAVILAAGPAGAQITGTLSNFDAVNNTGLVANDFQVLVGGILASSIPAGDLYNGASNPFAPPPGTVTQAGTTSIVKWGPNPGQQVNPGGIGHFGLKITGDLTPTSLRFEWTQNNTVIGAVPVDGTRFHLAMAGGLRNDIPNQGSTAFFAQRRINMVPGSITIDDLLVGNPVETTSIPIDPLPQLVPPGGILSFGYGPVTGGSAVMIVDFFEDQGGLPGQFLGTWLDAALLDPVPFPGTEDDLIQLTGVNGAPNSESINVTFPGDLAISQTLSPLGTYDGSPLLVLAEVFPTGVPPLPAFPGIAVSGDPATTFLLFGGPLPGTGLPLLLPPTPGFHYAFVNPGGFGGTSLMLQSLVTSPLSSNGIFATTDGHVVELN